VKKVIAAVAALQLAVAVALGAQQPGILRLFPPQPTGHVTDVAHLLDASTRDAIEARLAHLKAVTGGEVAVVTLPTIGDYAASDVALTIGRTWKVGADAAIGDRRRNAGVVILLVPRTAEHKGEINFATGNGTEGFITDAKAGEISDSMLPALRSGNYGAALDLGTSIVADLIARDLGVQDSALVRPRAERTQRTSHIPFRLVFYGIILFFWIVSLVGRNRRGGGRGGPGSGLVNSWILPYMIGRSFGGGGGFGGGGFGGGGGGGGFGGFGGGGGFSGGGGGRSF
jgi:uncharacterized protein